ncbi:heme NO-binding domain-containing protein [Hyalangium gracile]|uniref:heme NO-binding domain-containing protein n=1 Tax=Hyalangium gracile TaxID=394092 RepID=UPI001CCEB8F0|nr:heme NO-binding domain-containing protein [Hyalangium gracile]
MYGLVNRAIEEMVCGSQGEETWERIKCEAGVDTDVFIGNQGYDDAITYRLVGAASQVLGLPPERILEAFGEHWVLKTARDGYGELLTAGGSSLSEFLQNLPSLHARINLMFPHLTPPSFSCTNVTAESMDFHYRSKRQGLAPFMVGLLRGLGKLFDTEVYIEHIEARSAGADHDVYHLRWRRTQP